MNWACFRTPPVFGGIVLFRRCRTYPTKFSKVSRYGIKINFVPSHWIKQRHTSSICVSKTIAGDRIADYIVIRSADRYAVFFISVKCITFKRISISIIN